MKTNPTARDLRRRKYTEDDRILMEMRYLFEPVKVYEIKYITKDGEEKTYFNPVVSKRREHRDLTKEEIDFIHSHSVCEIAKHFNKSTTWAYARKAGNYTI